MIAGVTVHGLEWLRGDVQPVPGTASVALTNWEDLALADRARFVSDLQSMGLPEAVVNQGLQLRDRAAQSVDDAVGEFWASRPRRYAVTPPVVQEQATLVYNSARSTAWQRLQDWWGGQVIQVEDRRPVELHLPLFVFAAPTAAECRAKLATSIAQQKSLGWALTIVGSGLGGQGSVTVTAAATFEALSGQVKVIFLPLTVEVEEVVIRERDSHHVRRQRVDIAGLQEQRPAPGVALLDREELRPVLGPRVQTYPLASDPTGTVATYGYTYTAPTTARCQLGLTAHGVNLGVTAESILTTSVTLTYELRSGRDYRLFRVCDWHGLLWD
jgi:hypothetical protein